MISKIYQNSFKQISKLSCQYFGSSSHHKSDSHHHTPTSHHHHEVDHHHNHHNDGPLRATNLIREPELENEPSEQQLSRFRHIYFTDQNNNQSYFSFTNVVSRNRLTRSQAFLKLISQNFNTIEQQDITEFFRPPKIHENSIFVYQTRNLGNSVRYGRVNDAFLGLFVVFGMTYPFYALPVLGLSYFLWANAFFYEMSRRLVIRLDILPHLEMVSFTKVGAFGQLYNKLVRIDDLEKVQYEKLKDKENYFWQLNHHILDTGLIFRDKSTGELFCFDRQGFWDHEGLNHEQIN